MTEFRQLISTYLEHRTCWMATQHGKGETLAPLFRELGIDLQTPAALNTDALGTFTGEIERKGSPREVARQKCTLALELYGGDMAVASEGSFGSHPEVAFIPQHHELLFIVDRRFEWEAEVSLSTSDTNYAAAEVQNTTELTEFLTRVKFPSHAVILSPSPTQLGEIIKGITRTQQVLQKAEEWLEMYGSCYVQTDMRAHFNPTRMRHIERVGRALISKITRFCPSCSKPGFGAESWEAGLPCEACRFPTRSPLAKQLTCLSCGFEERLPYPYGKRFEDAAYCPLCNP